MKAFFNRFRKYKIETNERGSIHSGSETELPISAATTGLIGKRQKLVIIAMCLIGLILLLAIAIMVHSQASNENQLTTNESAQITTIVNQLKAIHAQLDSLPSHHRNSENFKQTLLTMNNEISAIKASLNSLATQNDIQQIHAQMETVKSDINDQLLDLKRVIVSGKDNKNFIDPSVLPFKVISIDVISQQPFASIDYDHHITPLTIGDSIAGWQVIAADYSDAWVEFKNDRDQYIKVSLQG